MRAWTLDIEEIKRRLAEDLTPTSFEHLVVSLLQLEHPTETWQYTGGPGDGGNRRNRKQSRGRYSRSGAGQVLCLARARIRKGSGTIATQPYYFRRVQFRRTTEPSFLTLTGSHTPSSDTGNVFPKRSLCA